jgi:hypothetical protein
VAARTPEQWLEETSPKKEALLKLFLGYAPGVGKTYSMLSEAVRRYSRGEDVIAGVVETHGRKPIVELVAKLPSLPRRRLEYKGALFEEMDVDALVARKPAVAVIDELAHTNVEGSKHGKRYEDVIDLLDAGIDVLSTMNVQHIESMTPMVKTPPRVVPSTLWISRASGAAASRGQVSSSSVASVSATSFDPAKPASAVSTIRNGNTASSVDSAMWLASAQPSSSPNA